MGYHLRIKICGVTTPDDARRAALLGADAIGLNFYPPSPRFLDPAAAERILGDLPPFVEPVGLFVNQPLRQVTETLQSLQHIHTIQWYGERHEPADPAPFRLIPAFNVRVPESLLEIIHFIERCRIQGHPPAAVLVDASVPGQYGGTGQTAPWDLLADFRPAVPLILAGGLTPDNVALAVRIVRPYAVDVASGVESSPGRKDAEKMRRFIDTAREAASRCE